MNRSTAWSPSKPALVIAAALSTVMLTQSAVHLRSRHPRDLAALRSEATPLEPNAAFGPTITSQANGDTRDRMMAFMREGFRLFKLGELHAARWQFLQAWQLVKHPAVAASLADTELKLGLYPDAAQHLTFALSEMSPTGEQAEDYNYLLERLDECLQHVVRLKVLVDRPGATVCVNGSYVGVSPLPAGLFVVPGEILVGARLGRMGGTRLLRAKAGAQVTATVDVTKDEAARGRVRPIDCEELVATRWDSSMWSRPSSGLSPSTG